MTVPIRDREQSASESEPEIATVWVGLGYESPDPLRNSMQNFPEFFARTRSRRYLRYLCRKNQAASSYFQSFSFNLSVFG